MPMERLGEVAETVRRSTVVIRAAQSPSAGSGVIWKPEGLIITNAHVLPEPQVTVQLWNGSVHRAAVVSKDARLDLAALQIGAGALPAVASRDTKTVRVGELVIAVGNPFGFIGAVSTGVVHAVGPLTIAGPLHVLTGRDWVQADVRLAPGNSGGPLADASGSLVGINTMVAGGLALAIPSNTVERFLRRGSSGASLGVIVRPVRVDDDSIGLLVLEVDRHGPAAQASLLAGDVLTGADGRPFRSLDDLPRAIEQAHGGALRLHFFRGGRRWEREVSVSLETKRVEAI
jgi:serine protease Do